MITINKFRNILNSPHPYYYYPGMIYLVALLIFFIAFLFLYFFEPFHIDYTEHKLSYAVICLLQSLLPTLIFLVYFLLLHAFRKRPVETGWTMKDELLHLLMVLLLMGSGNFFLRPVLYVNPNNWSFEYYVEEVGNTILTGVLLMLIFIPLNHFRINQKNVKLSYQLNANKPNRAKSHILHCFIHTQLERENFILYINIFLFAKAEGNYLVIFQEEEGKIKKYIKRMTLTQLEKQLKAFGQIFRTHRAYLINLDNVTQVTGNAQGLQISIHKCPDRIPVSRSKISDFRQKYSG